MPTNVTSMLLDAGIDARPLPDGTYVADRPDGGRVVFGDDDSGWWDFTAYDGEDNVLITDGAKTLDDILPALRQWTAVTDAPAGEG